MSALLRGITSKRDGDFYCLNCLYSLDKKKLELHKKVCENKEFRGILITSEDTKKLEFNQQRNSDMTPFIIYADLQYLIKKIDICKNNLEKSSTAT